MKHKTGLMLAMLLATLLALSGCGKRESTAPQPSTAKVQGLWLVYHTPGNSAESGPDYFNITQSGETLSGTSPGAPYPASFSGTVRTSLTGTTVTTAISISLPRGSGITYDFSGTVAGNSITGDYSAAGERGTWRASRTSSSPGLFVLRIYAQDGYPYEVWAGNVHYFNEPNYASYYYSIQNQAGYTKIDSAPTGGVVTITASYHYYVIAVPTIAYIDAVQLGFSFNYLGLKTSLLAWGGVMDDEKMLGAPDSQYTQVGIAAGSSGGAYQGYIIIANPFAASSASAPIAAFPSR